MGWAHDTWDSFLFSLHTGGDWESPLGVTNTGGGVGEGEGAWRTKGLDHHQGRRDNQELGTGLMAKAPLLHQTIRSCQDGEGGFVT